MNIWALYNYYVRNASSWDCGFFRCLAHLLASGKMKTKKQNASWCSVSWRCRALICPLRMAVLKLIFQPMRQKHLKESCGLWTSFGERAFGTFGSYRGLRYSYDIVGPDHTLKNDFRQQALFNRRKHAAFRIGVLYSYYKDMAIQPLEALVQNTTTNLDEKDFSALFDIKTRIRRSRLIGETFSGLMRGNLEQEVAPITGLKSTELFSSNRSTSGLLVGELR